MYGLFRYNRTRTALNNMISTLTKYVVANAYNAKHFITEYLKNSLQLFTTGTADRLWTTYLFLFRCPAELRSLEDFSAIEVFYILLL